MNKVLVEVRCIYGEDRYYPSDATALAFASLCRNKTLLLSDLRIIESLGYEIEFKTVHGKPVEMVRA